MPNAFTVNYHGLVRELKTTVHVSEAYDPKTQSDKPPTKEYVALWDTGATKTAISDKVITECNLPQIGVTRVHTASDEEHLTSTHLVNIKLPNKVEFVSLEVTKAELKNFDILIGMDIIGRGDFAISHKDGKSIMSFRMPSIESIDFVKKQHRSQKVGRNEPCPCNSGKKYKKCCGS